MLSSAIRQFNEKENKRREEEILENDFKRKLMEKYAEDEKLEQFNAMRRRQKEIDLKKEVIIFVIFILIFFRLKDNGKKSLDNIICRKIKKLMNLKDKDKKKLIRERLFKKKRKDLLLNMRVC
jgi:hypothetical protein